MKRRGSTAGHQDGSPDLFSELADYRTELRLETIKWIDLCLGTDVSDEEFNSSLRELGATDEQCREMISVLRNSDYELRELSPDGADAELAFLLLRLILGCVF